MSRLSKKAVSAMIAYVLLISISLTLSGLVYGWLKFYVEEGDVLECPTGVNLIVTDYTCNPGSETGYLRVGLKNKGRFNIDGYFVKVHTEPDAKFGIYLIDSVGQNISIGESVESRYEFADMNKVYGSVSVVDIQPFIMDRKDKVACPSVASQKIICS